MANSFKRAMALTLAAAMVATAVPATNFGTINADAASYKVTGTTAPYAKTTNKYVIKGLKKGMYAKVSITGNAKSKVTVKQGSKKIKASTKIEGTGKNITLKVTNKAAAGKKYNVVVKYFNKKGKQVKKITKKATVYAQTKSVEISIPTSAAVSGTTISMKQGDTLALTATKTPDKNTKKITWKSSDAKVATVKDGVVTATGGGKAKITATSGKASASVNLEVEGVAPVAKIAGAKQIAANSFELSFDIDASKTVKPENLEVKKADGTVIAVKSIDNWSQDGKTGLVTLFAAFADKGEYTITESASKSFTTLTASVGPVASIALKTTEAEQGVATPVKFVLLDDHQIDVTSATSDINARVSAVFTNIEGSYSALEDSKADSLKITMAKAGDKVKVVLTYDENTKDYVKKTVEGEILCIPAQEKRGTPLYAQSDEAKKINSESECFKFYNSLATTNSALKVEVGKTREDVYFTAIDKNGDAISYDNYEAEPGNPDMVSVTVLKSNGKYAKMAISGNKAGNTVINVKATVNGVASTYSMDVRVTKEGTLSQVQMTGTKSELSNAYDEWYFGELKDVKAIDDNNEEMKDVDWSFSFDEEDKKKEINNNTGLPGDVDADASKRLKDTDVDLGFYVSPIDGDYHAWGAKSGTYYVKAEATANGITKAKKVGIQVKSLSKAAWGTATSNNGVDLTYSVEFYNGRQTINESSGDNEEVVLLKATAGNLFAGYVRTIHGNAIVGSPIQIGTGSSLVVVDSQAAIASAGGLYVETVEKNGDWNDTMLVVTGRAASAQYNTATITGATLVYKDGLGTSSDLNGYTVEMRLGSAGAASIGACVETNGVITIGFQSSAAIDWKNEFEAVYCGLGTTPFAGAYIADDVVNSEAVIAAVQKLEVTTKGSISGSAVKTAFTSFDDGYGLSYDEDYNILTFVYGDGFDGTDFNRYARQLKIGDHTANEIFVASNTAIVTNGVDFFEGGFVEYDSEKLTGGVQVLPKAQIQRDTLQYGVKYGKYYSDGQLYNFDEKFGEFALIPTTGLYGAPYTSVVPVAIYVDTADEDASNKYFVVGDASNDAFFARTGSYTVNFTYWANGKKVEKTNTLKVEQKFDVPKITVEKRVIDSVDYSTIKENLKANVDLNNDNGNNVSIRDDIMYSVFTKNGNGGTEKNPNVKDATEDGGKMYVKYVIVKENTEVGDVDFFVPVGQTFSTK